MPRTTTNYGDTPHLVRGVENIVKEIFYSNPNYALTLPIQIMPGYGQLVAGTALALNKSAAGYIDYCLPYNPTTYNGTSYVHPGRLWLVANPTAGTAIVNVSLDDSYKLKVGDDLIINDYDTSAENLGAVTAITRYSTYAAITATTNISGTFTTAQYGYVCVEAGDSSNDYSDCVGVLFSTVDAGTGSNAKGAMGVLIPKNAGAVLYTGRLNLMDAAARTDISATTFGIYTII